MARVGLVVGVLVCGCGCSGASPVPSPAVRRGVGGGVGGGVGDGVGVAVGNGVGEGVSNNAVQLSGTSAAHCSTVVRPASAGNVPGSHTAYPDGSRTAYSVQAALAGRTEAARRKSRKIPAALEFPFAIWEFPLPSLAGNL